MKIIFCGSLVPESYDTKLKYLSPAANRFQINFCKELERLGNDIKIFSFVGFPLEGALPDFELENDFFGGCVKYIYKSKSMFKSVLNFMKEVAREAISADAVITYNVLYAWMPLSYWTRGKKIKSALILADFTESVSCENFARKLYARIQLCCIRKYYLVMGLSIDTKRLLNNNQNFICIQGGISDFVYEYFNKRTIRTGNIILMYSGLYESVTGIDLLLEAFHNIDDKNAELWLTGKGSLAELVRKYTDKDPRIINMGYLEYGQYLNKLGEASILINPRNMELKENRNNFPSKIMEYLATGKPIISTKFAGWEGFKENIFFCENNTQDISRWIKQLIRENIMESNDIYFKNRNFAEKFLWSTQVKIFLDYLK